MYSKEEVMQASLAYFKGDTLAADVFIKKYALRDLQGNFYEKTPFDMHVRLAKEFARVEQNYSNPMSFEEILGLFSVLEDCDSTDPDAYVLPSGRTVKGTGMGPVIPQGSPMSAIGNPFQVQSLGNCFVIDSSLDSYGSIMLTDQRQAQLMKRRAGVGHDISNIRPRDIPVANAARTADGIGIFMERFSNTTREVGQNSRRGALMISISVHHPEVEVFASIKRDLSKVTGANISVKLTDEFMQAVKADSEYEQYWPMTGPKTISRMVKAKQVWDTIIESAWLSAEPGILFIDTIHNQGPADVYPRHKTVSTNPCFSGDTLVALADGRGYRSIRELAEQGVDVPVYSINRETGDISVKMGRNPRITGKDRKLLRINLDDGTYFDVTPEHKVPLMDGNIVEARQLKHGNSLIRFNKIKEAVVKNGSVLKDQGYDAFVQDGHVFVNKKCEWCGKSFSIVCSKREVSFCSISCSNRSSYSNPIVRQNATFVANANAKKRGEKNKVEQAKIYNEFTFNNGRHPSLKEWEMECKNQNTSFRLNTKYGFKNFQEVASAGRDYNHKVVSVEELPGLHTVYNITVDDNHNLAVFTDVNGQREPASGVFLMQCGEVPMGPNSACRLMLINAYKCVKRKFQEDSYFDVDEWKMLSSKSARLMDDIVDLELECIDRILAKINSDPEPESVKRVEKELWLGIKEDCINGRRVGLGLTGLGDALAAMNIKYGSDESISATENIYRLLECESWQMSRTLAHERGVFPDYDPNVEKEHPFINKIWTDLGYTENQPRRNIAITTTAPAGSVSCLTQTTSGIEPAYLLHYKRRRKINTDETLTPDFVDHVGDKWVEYDVFHHGFKDWMDATNKGLDKIEESPYYGATSNDVDWKASVKLQAAAQKWVCHAISKTCNLPNSATRELVSEVYMKAWEDGCKGFTVYRDGCRTGVLVSSDSQNAQEGPEFVQHDAPKRPDSLPCEIHNVSIKGQKWTILVGMFEGKPYEVFGGEASTINVPDECKSATIVKSGNRYNLEIVLDDDTEVILKNIVKLFDNANYGTLTRMISLSLRHGAKVEYVCSQLLKDKEADLYSFAKVLSRVLKKHIPDGTIVTGDKKCKDCGSDSLVYMEGCVTCKSCGSSKCG